jgi:peptidoglycan-associated lipoprotein
MILVRLLALMAACAPLVMTACSKRLPPVTSAVEPPSAVASSPAAAAPPAPLASAPVPSSVLNEDDGFARKTLDELNAERPLGDALFDSDQYVIRDDARHILHGNAEWLRRWTSTRITIEGHCDARGTSEYNLALGERRASAVKEYLVSLGVASDRLVVVSKGEESPVCVENHEGCWQQNRRGHPIITAK